MTKGVPWVVCLCALTAASHAYESLQGATELLLWDRDRPFSGYTLFAADGMTYLIDMAGYVVHTWSTGTNPRLLHTGNLLDATRDDPSGFGRLRELEWGRNAVREHTQTREGYLPHHDSVRICDPKCTDSMERGADLRRVAATELFAQRGAPRYIRSDNGPEFTASKVRQWLRELSANTLFIEPGSPWENGTWSPSTASCETSC